MSPFEVLKVDYNYNHSECSSNWSIHLAALDPNDNRNKDSITTWCDYQSMRCGQRANEKADCGQHWSDGFVHMCLVHEDDRIIY